jgi:hypothetical protein
MYKRRNVVTTPVHATQTTIAICVAMTLTRKRNVMND